MLLSFVTFFQSRGDLSDRKTVYVLRFRFHSKCALHLPPEYKGFDHTVLNEFRQRLLKHGAESRVFNAIFAQLKQLGFYKQRGIQRTDSLSMLYTPPPAQAARAVRRDHVHRHQGVAPPRTRLDACDSPSRMGTTLRQALQS